MQMQSRQKTFALSVSRDMIPEAHLVVWHIFQGEVIADAINFFVNGTRINKVCSDWSTCRCIGEKSASNSRKV